MKLFLPIIMSLCFLRCSSIGGQNDEKGLITKRSYFPNGNIKAEAIYNKDSVKHGYGKLYYESGTLKLEVEYLNGKKHGIEKGYYQDGKLKYSGFNKNDHLIGEQLDYYEDGSLKFYSFYDPLGNGVYRASYSLRGELLKQDGSLEPYVVVKALTDFEFQIGDTLNVVIYVPDPPQSNKKLKLKIFDNTKQAEIKSMTLDIFDGQATYQERLSMPGEFYLMSSIEYDENSYATKLLFSVEPK